MTKYDRYRCPGGHSFLVAHVDGAHRPRWVPCAFCDRWAEFEKTETLLSLSG